MKCGGNFIIFLRFSSFIPCRCEPQQRVSTAIATQLILLMLITRTYFGVTANVMLQSSNFMTKFDLSRVKCVFLATFLAFIIVIKYLYDDFS